VNTKNITVTIDSETYRNARIKAAEADTSVSALVRSFLVRLAQGQIIDPEFQRLQRLQEETLDAIQSRESGLRSADNADRDALYDRNALR